MRVSARNVLKGKVLRLEPGAINTVVTMELAGGTQVVAVITKASAQDLGLTVGREAYAIIKASSVIVGVD